MIIPLSVTFFPEESDEQDVVVHYHLICDHEGCQAEAIPCFISPDCEAAEPDHYCPDHAPAHGFCAGCGLFAVGSFEDSLIPGCCPDCVGEMLAEVPASKLDVEVKVLAVRQQSGW